VSTVDWDAMVTVGRIVRPQGRRGEVVVTIDTDFAEDRFQPGATLWTSRAGQVAPVTVASSWPHQGRWVIGLVGVDSIDAADAWRGVELRVPATDLRPLEAGAFYVHDLLGCVVDTVGGERVGDVARVDLGSGTPLLAVQGTRGEVLVPLVEGLCRTVDVAGKRILIDPPDGLLELNVPGRGRSRETREKT
jgi:16S rRNA processing protein RimM